MLRYIDHSTLCDVTFVWFLLSWFVTRHVLYIFVILRSTWYDCPRLIPFEWDPVRERFLSKTAWSIFMGLLSALQVRIDIHSRTSAVSKMHCFQVIQMVWFWMICRVAWRVVMGENADDVRSEDGRSVILLIFFPRSWLIVPLVRRWLTKKRTNDL